MICTNANVRANLSEIRPTLKTPCLHLRWCADSVKSSESRCKSHFMRLYLHSFPLSVTKGANLRKEWIVKFILDAVFRKITMILWTLDSRVLWDVRRGFGARPSSFRKPYLAFSSHIKFSWGWWWWSIDLYSNTCNWTRLLRGFSDMVCINKSDSVPFLTLVKTLRSIYLYVFFFVSVFVSVCVSVFVSLFISW